MSAVRSYAEMMMLLILTLSEFPPTSAFYNCCWIVDIEFQK